MSALSALDIYISSSSVRKHLSPLKSNKMIYNPIFWIKNCGKRRVCLKKCKSFGKVTCFLYASLWVNLSLTHSLIREHYSQDVTKSENNDLQVSCSQALSSNDALNSLEAPWCVTSLCYEASYPSGRSVCHTSTLGKLVFEWRKLLIDQIMNRREVKL